jgi:hypothetical protein
MAMRGRTVGLEGFPDETGYRACNNRHHVRRGGRRVQRRTVRTTGALREVRSGSLNPQGDLLTYEVHYNSRLNKCFFEPEATMFHVDDPIDRKKNDVVHWITLIELLENKQYGGFVANTSYDRLQKAEWVVTVCTVRLSPELSEKLGYSAPQDATCETEDVWRHMVKQYMEEE